MKKLSVLFLITALVFTLLAGCSKPAPAEPAPTEPAAAPEAPAASAEDEVKDRDGILKLMGGSVEAMKKGLSYDYEMTAGGQTMTSSFSFKGENVRIEGTDPSNPSLMITKGKEVFMINPQEKTGFRMSIESDSDANPAGDVKPEENMDTDAFEITGKEDVNGEPCYIVKTKNIVDGYEMKMWIHRKYGILMKMESESPDGNVLVEVKNLQVGDIPDSDFDIPADIKMQEMPTAPQ